MPEPKESDAKEPKAKEPKAPIAPDTNVIGTSETTTKTTFRTDMGESLPPQKKPGVE